EGVLFGILFLDFIGINTHDKIFINKGIIKEEDESHGFSCFEPVPGSLDPEDRQLQVGHQKHFSID
ncbi:hypothetical protein ACOI1C_15835, partial [Bacillus sp. DJP31]|uniref:hypothetical protein n=1 Tax=Bacillus sp. DJP31 TaxID=3409789 RepID=UPI003BB565DA